MTFNNIKVKTRILTPINWEQIAIKYFLIKKKILE